MKTVIDQMNREVKLPDFPKRIVSLVPSQTELLFDLGLGDRVVGITKFCIHPYEWYAAASSTAKKRIGGTKNVNFEALEQLNPDLIIGNKEENTETDIKLLKQKYPVWMSDINTFEDALAMINKIGRLTQTEEKAHIIAQEITLNATEYAVKKSLYSCVYLIWNEPIMVAGKSTFIDTMLDKAGFINLISTIRYPEISKEQLINLQPDFLLLSSEPFPFKESHVFEFQQLLPNTKVMIVDGEMFSWYGSRLRHSFQYFSKIDVFKLQE